MLASSLDPRYKKLLFLPEEQRAAVYNRTQTSLCELSDRALPPATPTVPNEEEDPPEETPQSNFDFLSQFAGDAPSGEQSSEEDGSSETLNQNNSRAHRKIVAQYKAFLEEPAETNPKANPLVFWKSNASRYNLIVKGAKRFLSIPATSVPSESTFSTAGFIASKSRSSLLPENVDMLVFMRHNRHHLNNVVFE